MQAPPVKDVQKDHDVVVIPEAGSPRGLAPIVAVALGILGALLLGIVAGSAWQRNVVSDRNQQIAAAVAAARTQEAAALAARAQLAQQDGRISALTQALGQAHRHTLLLLASRQEARNVAADMRAQLDNSHTRLGKAHRRAVGMTGPSLPDGRSIGRIVLVGATQSPPRLVFDVGVWLRGQAAHAAAVADGVIHPGQRLPHHRYFRNLTSAWRMVRVSSSAGVTIRHWRGHPGVRVVGIHRLQRMFAMHARWARVAVKNPFWVTVSHGTIQTILEQRYP